MTSASTSRRSFLGAASAASALWLFRDLEGVEAALAHAASAVAQTPPPAFTTLAPNEAVVLDAMAARIMPTTDTPGAREAGVIYFMDKWLGGQMKDALPGIRLGIADLNRRSKRLNPQATSYAALDPLDQDRLLLRIQDSQFFGSVRFLTMLGMFANPSYGGNRDQTGWKLLDFKPAPKHAPPFGYYDTEVAKKGTGR